MHKILVMLAALMAALPVAVANAADSAPYPNRPIRLLNPFAPGGTVDINARVLAAEVAKQIGGNIVIDNRDGANGIVGTQIVVNAPPDGYTFLHTSTSIAINPSVYKKMPYDALKDLVPITFVALSAGYVVVAHPGFAARSMKDVIELAKNAAKPVAYSTAGIGNSTHLVTEMFNGAAGISTDPTPLARFYEDSAAELIAANRPFMIVFASPAFCVSQACGPTLKVVKAAAAQHPSVSIIHVEPYVMAWDGQRPLPVMKGGHLQPNPITEAWRLPVEPWIFTVGPDGTILRSYEGVVSLDELNAALAELEGL